MNISNLWAAWPIPGPWHISPLSGGTNNLIFQADTADGKSYVLRLSEDLTRIPHIYHEAKLLEALSEKSLSFQLPLPLKANSGDIIVRFEQEDKTEALAILTPLLPGSLQDLPHERNDLRKASQAGATLALLDNAFANLPEIHTSKGYTPLPTFGDFAHWHPLVPDPLAAIEQLSLDQEITRQIRTYLNKIQESIPELYSQLPQQLLHRDYTPGNILMDDQGVTAVLDFEFAGKDIRILDLCVALSWWPAYLMGTGKEWDLIDAFGSAYTNQVPLSEEELRAIPATLRLRDATSFVHRIGRYFAGQETEIRIRNRVQHSLWREEWLSTHQETLLEHILGWK